jgi:hypothetical protein
MAFGMARKRSKAKPRSRSRKPAFSISNAAQTFIVANGVSLAMFKVDALTFLGLAKNFGRDGQVGNNSNELTAMEIFNRVFQNGSGGMSSTWQAAGGLPNVIKSNLKGQMPLLITATVGVPLAFKFGKQILAKPLLNPLNRTLKIAGIKGVKV